jgi:hypothetical protein
MTILEAAFGVVKREARKCAKFLADLRFRI